MNLKKHIFFLSLLILFNNNFCFAKEIVYVEDLEYLIRQTLSKEATFNKLDVDINHKKENIKDIRVFFEKATIDKVEIDQIEVKTLNKSINIEKLDNHFVSKDPLQIEVGAQITEHNLARSLDNNWKKYLQNIKVKIGEDNYMHLNFLNPQVRIEDSKIKADAILYINGMPEFMKFPVTFEARPNIINKKVVLQHLFIVGLNISSLNEALTKENLVIFDLSKEEKRNNVKLNQANVEIHDNYIYLKGVVTLPENSKKFGLKDIKN